MTETEQRTADPATQEPPEETPPLGSWRRMYTLVLASLALLIALFYAFTRAFD